MGYPKELLANNERVLLQAKKHPLFMILKVAPWVIGAIALLGLSLLAWWLDVRIVSGLFGIIFLIGALAALAYAAYLFLIWKMELFLVTNYRIVQIEGIVNRETFDSALEMVNDVQMRQSVFGRMFNFGTVKVITGSDMGVNDLPGISRPFDFKRALLEAKLVFAGHGERMPVESTEFARQAVGAGTHEQPTGPFKTVENESDPIRVVSALNELRNAGMLTEAEFNEKLRQLTDRS